MPALSSELPRRSLTKKANKGWVASRQWMVTGAASESDALAATPLDGQPIPLVGASHPQNSFLLVVDVTPAQQDDEPFVWTVTANYEIVNFQGDISLLKRPIEISMKSGRISIAVDRDYQGRPYVNSAGDAFNPPRTRTIKVRCMKVVRYEPYYDVDKADTFENTVNLNPITIAGKIFVAEKRIYCESIEAEEAFTADSIAIPIAYNFVLRRDLDDSPHPFNDYIKDEGRRGWYSRAGVPTSGEFCHADGTQVSEPIALDGTGMPTDSTIRVLGGSPDAPTYEVPVGNPNRGTLGLAIAPFSTVLVKFLEFRAVEPLDYLQMGL